MPIAPPKLTALVIEDNQGDFVLIEDYLNEEIKELQVYHAATLQEAKKYFTQESQLDIIFLDLSLPDGSGDELVKYVVAQNPDTPIIVLTGFADREYGVRTLSFGVADYLLKDELNPYQLSKSIAYTLERKRITQQLKESEKKYKDLFQLSPSPMFLYDVETYQFLDANISTLKHYGYTKEEFLALTARDIRPETEFAFFTNTMKEIQHQPFFQINNVTHLKKNGEPIYVDIQSNLVEIGGRKARLILATDVSEKTKHIQAIEIQNKKLQEIAWVQAHIVRAPLARMMGLINLLFDEDNPSEESAELLKYLEFSAHELDTIVKDIIKKAEEAHLFDDDDDEK